jgi:enoyl-CoA hydratase/carnithine racemase
MTSPDSIAIDTRTDELLAARDGHVAIITLNRPHARNALSDNLSPALRDILPKLAADPDVRSLLITRPGNSRPGPPLRLV